MTVSLRMFQKRCEASEGESHENIWGNSVHIKRMSPKFKGPGGRRARIGWAIEINSDM